MKTSDSRLLLCGCEVDRRAHYRFFLRFGAWDAVIASVHILNMSLAALLTAMVDCRLASAAIRPRALRATEFAPLSHMLMNGFFLSQGLDIDFLRASRAAAIPVVREVDSCNPERCGTFSEADK